MTDSWILIREILQVSFHLAFVRAFVYLSSANDKLTSTEDSEIFLNWGALSFRGQVNLASSDCLAYECPERMGLFFRHFWSM